MTGYCSGASGSRRSAPCSMSSSHVSPCSSLSSFSRSCSSSLTRTWMFFGIERDSIQTYKYLWKGDVSNRVSAKPARPGMSRATTRDGQAGCAKRLPAMSSKYPHRRKSTGSTDNKYVLRERPKSPNFQLHASHSTSHKGYDVWRDATGDGSADVVKVHRLVAVAEYGFDAVADMHVHHRNNISWDNRPDNLELQTPSEHPKLHNEIDEEDLLDDLRMGAIALGETPRPIDMERFGEYNPKTYYNRFGSWEDALEEAGLDE